MGRRKKYFTLNEELSKDSINKYLDAFIDFKALLENKQNEIFNPTLTRAKSNDQNILVNALKAAVKETVSWLVDNKQYYGFYHDEFKTFANLQSSGILGAIEGKLYKELATLELLTLLLASNNINSGKDLFEILQNPDQKQKFYNDAASYYNDPTVSQLKGTIETITDLFGVIVDNNKKIDEYGKKVVKTPTNMTPQKILDKRAQLIEAATTKVQSFYTKYKDLLKDKDKIGNGLFKSKKMSQEFESIMNDIVDLIPLFEKDFNKETKTTLSELRETAKSNSNQQLYGDARFITATKSGLKSLTSKSNVNISQAILQGLLANYAANKNDMLQMENVSSANADVNKFVKDLNALVIDTETRNLSGKAVSFGYANKDTNGLAKEVLFNTDTLGKDLYEMLSKPGLQLAATNVAKRLGLDFVGKNDNGISTYKTSEGYELTDNDLKTYTNLIQNEMAKKNKFAKGTTTVNGHNIKHDEYEYEGMTPDLYSNLVSAAAFVYGANILFDEATGKKSTGIGIEGNKLRDIFDVVREAGKKHAPVNGKTLNRDYHSLGGWNVSALLKILLNEDEQAQAKELHGAGADTQIEAMIAAKMHENPKFVEMIINAAEESMKKTYEALHGKSVGKVSADGKSFEYSEDYKTFRKARMEDNSNTGILDIVAQRLHGVREQYAEVIGTNDYDKLRLKGRSQASKQILNDFDALVKAKKFAMSEQLAQGYKDSFVGKTLAKRISDIAGRDVKAEDVNSTAEYVDDLMTYADMNDLYAGYELRENDGKVYLDLMIDPNARNGRTDAEIEAQINSGNLDVLKNSFLLTGGDSTTDYKNASSIDQLFTFVGGVRRNKELEKARIRRDATLELLRNGMKDKYGNSYTTAKEGNDFILRQVNKQMKKYSVTSANGQIIDDYSGVSNEITRYQRKMLMNELTLTPLFEEVLRNSDLKNWIYNDEAKRNKVDLNQLDGDTLRERFVRPMALAASRLKNNSPDELNRIKQSYVRGGKTNEFMYQLLFGEAGKFFREQIDFIEGYLGIGGLSVGKVGSGKLSGIEPNQTWATRLGIDTNEAWSKTKPTGLSTKAGSKNELLKAKIGGVSAFLNSNIYDELFEERLAMETPEAFLSKDVLEQFMRKTGLNFGVSDEWVYVGKDFAKANKGIGGTKRSDKLTDKQIEGFAKKIRLLNEKGQLITDDDIKGMEFDSSLRINAKNNRNLRTWLSLNFAIPEDAYLEELYRDANGDYSFAYRQSGDILHASKGIGKYGERVEFGLVGDTTEYIRGQMLAALGDIFEENIKDLAQQLSDKSISQELYDKELDLLIKKRYADIENIKKAVMFREDNAKRKSSLRTNAQYLAPAMSSLFRDQADKVSNILGLDNIFSNFAKQFYQYDLDKKLFRTSLPENWRDYKITEADKAFLGLNATTEDVIAALNTTEGEKSVLENFINKVYDESTANFEVERLAAKSRGTSAINLYNKSTFFDQSGNTFGNEAEELNEVALYGENGSHFARMVEELETVRDQMIADYTSKGIDQKLAIANFNKMKQDILNSYRTTGPQQQAALDKYNSIIGAFGANQLKLKDKSKFTTGKEVLEFDYAQFDNIVKNINRPAENNRFTAEEYENGFLQQIYAMQNQSGKAHIGDRNTAFKFNIALLLRQKGLSDDLINLLKGDFAEHGFDNIYEDIFLGLEKELSANNKGEREYTGSQRALGTLLSRINSIIAGNADKGKGNYYNEYQVKLQELRKNLFKEMFSGKAGSAYLMSGQASDDSKYSFINKNTALKLNKFDSREKINKENIEGYLSTLFDPTKSGSDSDTYDSIIKQYLNGNKRGDKALRKALNGGDLNGKEQNFARLALDLINQNFILNIVDLAAHRKEDRAAQLFGGVLARSPYLTMFSLLENSVIVKGRTSDTIPTGLRFDDSVYDNVIFLNKDAQKATKADFDGDIIAIYRRVIDALNQFGSPEAKEAAKSFLQYIEKLKSDSLSYLKTGKGSKGEEIGVSTIDDPTKKYRDAKGKLIGLDAAIKQILDTAGGGDKSLYEKIKAEGKTAVDPVLKAALEEIQMTGLSNVGLANWDDEHRRAAMTYQSNLMGNSGKNTSEFMNSADIISAFYTEQGQQNNISVKKVASMLLKAGDGSFVTSLELTDFYNDLAASGLKKETIDLFRNNPTEALQKMLPLMLEALDSDQMRLAVSKLKTDAYRSNDAQRISKANAIESSYLSIYAGKDPREILNRIGGFFDLVEKQDGVADWLKLMRNKDSYSVVTQDRNKLIHTTTGADEVALNAKNEKNLVDTEAALAGKKTDYDSESKDTGSDVPLANFLISYAGYLDTIVNLLQYIVTNTAGGSGKGGSGEGWKFNGNPILDKITLRIINEKKSNSGSSFSTSSYDNVKLDTSNGRHSYIGIDDVITATLLGSDLFGSLTEAEKAQLKGMRDKLAGKGPNGDSDKTILTREQAQLVMLSDFKFSAMDGKSASLLNLLASSLLGTLQHEAFRAYGLAAQRNNTALDLVEENLVSLMTDLGYEQAYDNLVNFFGGNEEAAKAYIETQGTGYKVFKEGIDALKKENPNMSMDANEYLFEKSLAFKASYKDENGNTISQNVGVTPDVIATNRDQDGNIIGLQALDLKNKKPGQNISEQDMVEGVVLTLGLASLFTQSEGEDFATTQNRVANLLNSLGDKINAGDIDPTKLESLRENTLGSLTKFVQSKDGKAAIGSILLENPELGVEGLFLQFLEYRGKIKSGQAPQMLRGDLPISQENTFSDLVSATLQIVLDLNQALIEANKNKLLLLEGKADQSLIDEAQARIDELEGKASKAKENLNNVSHNRTDTTTELNVAFVNSEAQLAKQQQKVKEKEEGKDENYRQLLMSSRGLIGSIDSSIAYRINMFFLYTLGSMVIGLVTNNVKKLVGYMQLLNKSLVNLLIATGDSNKETNNLLKTYSNFAALIGKTTTEVAEAANDWLRAGYNGKEASELVEASMYLSTLGMMLASDATSSLISILKGWKLSSEDVIKVVDKLVTVDMSAAVSAGDIANAMSKVNYSALSAGIGMDTLMGILTTNQEISQLSPELIGRAWRTIIARMQNVKAGKYAASNVEQASSDYDEGNYESLNDVETVLRSAGVTMRDSANTWRNSEDILNEIASKWQSFSDITQSAIANAMAGTRQREQFILTMENWESVSGYAKLAALATGTAAQKMESYTSSVEAAKNRITAAWENLALELDGSSLIASFYNAVANIIDNIGMFLITALPLGIAAIVTKVTVAGNPLILTFATLKQHLISTSSALDRLAKSADNASGNTTKKVTQTTGNLTKSRIGSTMAILGSTIGTTGAAAAGEYFNLDERATTVAEGVASMLPILANAFGPWGGIIVGGLETIAGSVFTFLNYVKLLDIKEAKENYNEAKESYEALALNGESAAEVIEKYRYGVNSKTGANISLTDEEYAEFLEASDTLLESVDGLDKVYNSEGKAIIKLSSLEQTGKGLNETGLTLVETINKQMQENKRTMAESLTNKNVAKDAFAEFEKDYLISRTEYAEKEYEKYKEGDRNEAQYTETDEIKSLLKEKEDKITQDVKDAVYKSTSITSIPNDGIWWLSRFITKIFSGQSVASASISNFVERTNVVENSADYEKEKFGIEYDQTQKLSALMGSMYSTILGYVLKSTEYYGLSLDEQERLGLAIQQDKNILALYEKGQDSGDYSDLEDYMKLYSKAITDVFNLISAGSGKSGESVINAIENASTIGLQNKLVDAINNLYSGLSLKLSDLQKSVYESLGFEVTETPDIGMYRVQYKDSYQSLIENALGGAISDQNLDQVSAMSLALGQEFLTIAKRYQNEDIAISRYNKLNYSSDALTAAQQHMMDASVQYNDFQMRNQEYQDFITNYKEGLKTTSKTPSLIATDIVNEFGLNLTEQGVDAISSAIKDTENDIDTVIRNLGNTLRSEITSSYAEEAVAVTSKYFGDLSLNADKTLASWKGVSQMIDLVTSDFEKLKSALSEQIERGYLSLETVADLIARNSDYIDIIEYQNGQFKLKDNAELLMLQHEIDAMKINLEYQYEQKAASIETLKQEIATAKSALDSSEVTSNSILDEIVLLSTLTEAIKETTLAVLDLTTARMNEAKRMGEIASGVTDFDDEDYITTFTSYYDTESKIDKDKLETYREEQEKARDLTAELLEAKQALLVTEENELKLIKGLLDSLENIYNEDGTIDWTKYSRTVVSASGNVYEVLDLLKDAVEALNKEYLLMITYQADIADGMTSISEEAHGMRLLYYEAQGGLLTTLANKYLAFAAAYLSNGDIENYYKYLKEYQDTIVKINNLDDELVLDQIDIYEALGLSSDILVDQYSTLLQTADTLQERIEYENKVVDAQRKQAELADTMLSTYQELISYRQEYASMDADLTTNTQLYTDSRAAYEKSARLNMSLAEDAWKRAKQRYLENGGSEEYADYYANSDDLFLNYLNKAISAYKAIGQSKVSEFENSMKIIDEEISNYEFTNKPSEWTLDAEGGMSNIVSYYSGLIDLYTKEVELCSKQLNDTTDLTDELILSIKNKGQEAIKKISELQEESLESLIQLQEEVYEALEWQVNEYISNLEKLKEVVTDIYDTEIKKLQDKNDSIERTNKLLELLNNLLNAQEEKKRVYRSGIGWVYETDRTAVKKAQQELDAFYRQDNIDDLNKTKDKELEILDENIKNWQNYLDMLQTKYQTYENNQKAHLAQQALGQLTQQQVFQLMVTDMQNYTVALEEWEKGLYGSGEGDDAGETGKIIAGQSAFSSSLIKVNEAFAVGMSESGQKVVSAVSGMNSGIVDELTSALDATNEDSLISKLKLFNSSYTSAFDNFLTEYNQNKITLLGYKTEVNSALDLSGPIGTFMSLIGAIDSETSAQKVSEALGSNNIPKVIEDYINGFKTSLLGDNSENGVILLIITKINNLIDKIKELNATPLESKYAAYVVESPGGNDNNEQTGEEISESLKKYNNYSSRLKSYMSQYQDYKDLANNTYDLTERDEYEYLMNDAYSNIESTVKYITSTFGNLWKKWETDEDIANEIATVSDYLNRISNYKALALALAEAQALAEYLKLVNSFKVLAERYSSGISQRNSTKTEKGKEGMSKIADEILTTYKEFYDKDSTNKAYISSCLQRTNYKNNSYSSGLDAGPVTYTGLAMLHGTPSNPEYVLNSDQTYNLLKYLTSAKAIPNANVPDSSTNYNIAGDIVLENCNDPAKFWQDVTNAMSNRFNVTKNRK